jgi:hypothetical protein
MPVDGKGTHLVSDDALPSFPTRRQLREAEQQKRLPSRRELRNLAAEAHQEKTREKLASDPTASVAPATRRSDGLSSTPREMTPADDTAGFRGVLSAPTLSASAPLTPSTPAAPAPLTTTIPAARVVDHDTTFDVAPSERTKRRRLPDTVSTHTFPVTISPRVDKVRPLERKTPAQRALTWTVMIAAPLLFIGVSMPVNLFYAPTTDAPAIASETGEADTVTGDQAFVVGSAETPVSAISRESWSVNSYAEVLRSRYGGRSYNYAVTQGGAIRWPFPVAVPISSGFGNRIAPCRYCSSYHRGIDFVPGSGTPTYSMAAGVVTQSEFSGGYGQHVYIEHQIGGQSVLSVYAHLQRDSSPLRVGDIVQPGDFVGLVGSTGTSTGAHLHFEVRIDGVYIDPFAYLTANAG